MTPVDPASQIQTLIDNAATEHMAIMAGLISPDVANSPTILYAGKDVWNTQHKPLTVTAETPFLIASITKTFTSNVQYLLHENYDGSLGDFISVPGYPLPPALASLPILDLANYSPGFPTDNKGTWLPKGVADTLESLIKYLSASTNLPQNVQGTS
jgi:CubicO group peptidase (beta-lactamase class C family)